MVRLGWEGSVCGYSWPRGGPDTLQAPPQAAGCPWCPPCSRGSGAPSAQPQARCRPLRSPGSGSLRLGCQCLNLWSGRFPFWAPCYWEATQNDTKRQGCDRSGNKGFRVFFEEHSWDQVAFAAKAWKQCRQQPRRAGPQAIARLQAAVATPAPSLAQQTRRLPQWWQQR